MKVSKTLFSLSVPPQVKGGCGSGWEGNRTEFHKSIHSFNNFSLLKMIHNIQDFQKCVKEYNGAAVTGADDILHRQCKYMLNNLNVLVKVLDNLVGTLATQRHDQEEIVTNEESPNESQTSWSDEEVTNDVDGDNAMEITDPNERENDINTANTRYSPCALDKKLTEVFAEVETKMDLEEGNKNLEIAKETTVEEYNTFDQIKPTNESNKEKQASYDGKDCRICYKSYTTKLARKRHEIHFHVRRDIPCQHCKHIFKNQKELEFHIKAIHVEKRIMPFVRKDCTLVYRCLEQNCGEEFDKEDTFLEHRSTHTSLNKVPEHRKQTQMKEQPEKEESVTCPQCKTVLKNVSCLPGHIIAHHPHKKCPNCEKSLETDRALLAHIKRNHQNVTLEFLCPICKEQEDPSTTTSFTFPSSVLLKNHCRLKHFEEAEARNLYKFTSDEKLTEKCDICNKYFFSLEQHISKVHPKEGFPCQVCSKVYNFSDSLRSHIKTAHSDFGRVTCEICGASLKHEVILRDHMRKFHGEKKPIIRKKCPHPDCLKILKDAATAKQHYQRVHALTRSIKCHNCDKMYKTKIEMESHFKNMHTELNHKIRRKRKPVVKPVEKEGFQNVKSRKSKRVFKRKKTDL